MVKEGFRFESLRVIGVESRWGSAWVRRVVAGVLALVTLVMPARWWLGISVAPFLALGMAASGHALSASSSPVLPVMIIFIHTMAAGLWLGYLWVTSSLYPGESDPATQIAAFERFSRVARFAGPLAFFTGAIAALTYLNSWSALLSSGYGRVLLLKVSALATAAGIGAYHWLVALPRVRRDPTQMRKMRESVGLELAFGVVAIVLTATLVALPM